MLPLPRIVSPLVDTYGKINQGWNNFLQQFSQPPQPFITLTVSGSPFQYVGKEPGHIFITGGTITGLTLSRGVDALALATTMRIIPIEISDLVTVTYSVLPVVTFVPRY